MNLLGVDYGSKHVGLAISQDKGLALGFMTISESSAISEIKRLVKENAIEVVVVGFPENGQQSDAQLRTTKNFINKLAFEIPQVKISSFDEKMTTKMARRYSSKAKEHQEAARIILDDWMRRNLA